MRNNFWLKIILTGVVLIGATFVVLILVNNFKENSEPEIQMIEHTVVGPQFEVIGKSVEGRDIEVIKIGEGENNLLFVGGIHGGYEWNSVVLAYELIDYFVGENFLNGTVADKEVLPKNISLHIIPNLNPDGFQKVLGLEGEIDYEDVLLKVGNGVLINRTELSEVDFSAGRFNANNVDLNRNFDCKWQPESSWRGQKVSAGTQPFSEPEARALRDYVERIQPSAVVFWHSQANTVYASECYDGVLPTTRKIMNLYAMAADYNQVETFDAYEVTGDAEGWLASIGVPAITVELQSRETVEFDRNLSGVKSLIEYFGDEKNQNENSQVEIFEIQNNPAENNSLIVSRPIPDQIIENPLSLSGKVRGSWLFEASMPVVLTDWNGLIIGESYIQAEENWMTENFVPFTGSVSFEIPGDIGDFSDFGYIIFQKANPSGLSEHDDALEFRVRFR